LNHNHKILVISIGLAFTLATCSTKNLTVEKTEAKTETFQKTIYPSDVIPFFQHWNLILGDGSNAGQATNFENKDFFYATNDGKTNWAVFKTPNAGNTH